MIDAKEIVPDMAEKVIRNVKVVQPKKDDGKNKEKDEGKSNLRGTKNPYVYVTYKKLFLKKS